MKSAAFYFYLSVGFLSLYVIFMWYVFPKPWSETPQAIALINFIAAVVPMLHKLRDSPIYPMYNNFWGIFYAIFWAFFAPCFVIVGYVGTICQPLNKERRNYFQNFSIAKLIIVFLAIFSIILFVFTTPAVGDWRLNEISNHLSVLLFACFEIATLLFSFGAWLAIFKIKLNVVADQNNKRQDKIKR
jgi:hypothetical protein